MYSQTTKEKWKKQKKEGEIVSLTCLVQSLTLELAHLDDLKILHHNHSEVEDQVRS